MNKRDKLNLTKFESKFLRLFSQAKGILAENGIFVDRNLRYLSTLKDIHKGKTAYLIGNGPSVRVEDLEILKTGGVSFCCNRFYLAYNRTSFRPTYTLASDRQTISDFGQELVKCAEGEVFITSIVDPHFEGNYTWICQQNKNLFASLYRGANPGGGTIIFAIQLAWHMGIRDFVLYGIDHNYPVLNNTGAKDVFYSATGEGNHFIPDYRSGKPWCPPIIETIEESFSICREYILNHGGTIVNATRGGKLEIFPRVSIEDYLQNA